MNTVLPPHSGLLLFVNFHHIREKNPSRFPNLHHVSVQQFNAQIQALKKLFNFPHPNEVKDILESQSRQAHCVLTFDDGLKDHYEYVMPILKQHQISGLFSINTLPWEKQTLTSVHQAHLLSAAYSYVDIAPDILEAARALGVKQSYSDFDPHLAQAQYRYDTLETAKIKYFLNAIIPQNLRHQVVGTIFKAKLGDPKNYVEEHCMTPSMAREMFQDGLVFAAHTHQHLHLASASREERLNDLKKNHFFIKTQVTENQNLDWISYPYGSPSSYDESVFADAQSLGHQLGLTMKRGINILNQPIHKMQLARVDTNDVIGGKRPYSFEELLKK